MAVAGFQFESTASGTGTPTFIAGAAFQTFTVQATVWTINGTNRNTKIDGSYLVTSMGICQAQGALWVASGTLSGDGNVTIQPQSTGTQTTVTVNPWNLTTTHTTHNANYSGATALPVAGQMAKAYDGAFGQLQYKDDGATNKAATWSLVVDMVIDVYPMAIGLMMTL